MFDRYHFGTKGYDNGILILIDKQSNSIRIATGYGVEGSLSDLYLKHLMRDAFTDNSEKVDGKGGTNGGGGAASKIKIKIKSTDLNDKSNSGTLYLAKHITDKLIKDAPHYTKHKNKSDFDSVRVTDIIVTFSELLDYTKIWMKVLAWTGIALIVVTMIFSFIKYPDHSDPRFKSTITSNLVTILMLVIVLGILSYAAKAISLDVNMMKEPKQILQLEMIMLQVSKL